jgi:hypothetical protein
MRTNEELNHIIAEWVRSKIPDSGTSVAQFGPVESVDPRYCTDLNAMHEAEKKLTGVLYCRRLLEVIYPELTGLIVGLHAGYGMDILRATARQRAEALVMVIESK